MESNGRGDIYREDLLVIETIVGGALGAISRLAPEIINFFDRKNERKHELAMGVQQYDLAKLQSESAYRLKDREVEGEQFTSAMEAMKAGIEAQGKQTGVRWVDALNALVRPTITFWIFSLYSIAKTAQIHFAHAASDSSFQEAVLATWSPADEAMLSAVLTFYFIGRVWERTAARTFR